MARRNRAGFLVLVGTMTVPAVIAGMAWACGPSGYGVPEAPTAPPASTAQPGPSATAPAPPAAGSPQSPPVEIKIETGSATTKSVAREASPQSPRAPSQRVAVGGNAAPSPAARAEIVARVGGSTDGVVSERGQSVFASSTAPSGTQKTKSAAKSKASPSVAGTPAPAVSERSATGDLWGAIRSSGQNPSLSSAAAGGPSGGLSGTAVAGIAILALGLAGITGGALATAGRRRRAGAGAAKR